jgi:hypothetical protein
MSYGHAVLGESIELYNEAIEWGKNQKERTEKNAKARMIIMESLAPMLEEKRKLHAINPITETNKITR